MTTTVNDQASPQDALASEHRFGTGFYLALVTLSAAMGLAVEIIAGRMIAPYVGMSLYTWTAIIAVVLAGFSLGHWFGGRIAMLTAPRAARSAGLALLGAAATTAASLVLIRAITPALLAANLGSVPTILVLTTLLFFAPSMFVGIPSPVLTKLAIDAAPGRMGHTLGLFYAAGALGSILGTLAAGYVMISWLGTQLSLLVIAIAYAAMGLALVAKAAHLGARPVAGDLAKPLGALLLLAAAGAAAAHRFDALVPSCAVESQYYCLRIDDVSANVGAEARVLVLDHLAHGINVRDAADALVSPYAALQSALIETHLTTAATMRAFFVGGGAYTVPRALSHRFPAARIIVAEIDPAVTGVARQHMWFEPGPSIHIRHLDARRALAALPAGSLDVVVGDAFHDIAVPPHLVTREFMSLVAQRLDAGGIYVMNVVDSSRSPRLAASLAATLEGLFPVVELWSERDDGNTSRRSTMVLFAGPRSSPASRLTLGDGTVWERWTNERVAKAAAGLGAMVLTDDFAPVDRIIGVE
ncbi:MAG: fused MFS/spermidine synthase [Hyphomicrobiaceae bacterium]